MNTSSTPYRTIPFDRLGATRLHRDFLNDDEALRPFFGSRFDDEAALGRQAKRIQQGAYDREGLYETLRTQAAEVGATPPALKALERFRAGSLVVFAGQQTGLFTGPLYTVYKALTVERWARDLSARLGQDVVPMFWLSADDHDFAEVEWLSLPHEGRLATVRYRPEPEPGGAPVGRVRIDAGMADVLSELSGLLPDSEFKPGVLETLGRAYAPGSRYAAAMGRLWYAMFPHSQLVCVLPGEGALARAAAPVLCRAIEEEAELFEAYRTDSDLLVKRGYHEQVHKSPEQTFLFHQREKRSSIHTTKDGLAWEGGPALTRAKLLAQVQEYPEHFSPNVLLRPLVQNALFPTLGVVVGPSELAYYAQIGRLHDHYGVPRPIVLPRTSATVLEAQVAKRLMRHEVDPAALYTELDFEVARVLRARFPGDLRERFETAAQRVEALFDEIRPVLGSFEPTLEAPAKAAGVRARREIEQLAQKAHSAHKKKEEETEGQIRRAALQLFPDGQLQERRFNVVYYWARYGPEWLSRLYDRWPAGLREHLLWEG